MRKSRKETAETRKRILAAAAEAFRHHGVDGTSLDDVMTAAGMTHGGFYKHFSSKEQLVAEAFATAAASTVESMRTASSVSSGPAGLPEAVATYLSLAHRDDTVIGCPLVALGSEVARRGAAVRGAATASFLDMVEVLASRLHGLSSGPAHDEAIVMLTTMIGAMTMARAVTDPDLSASILGLARRHLLQSLPAGTRPAAAT